MALQSQMLRGSSNIRSSSAMRPRGRGQRRLLGVVLLALVVGGGLIWVARGRDGGGAMGPQAARADTKVVTQTVDLPLKDPIATPPAPKPEPMVLEMGSRPRAGKAAPMSALPGGAKTSFAIKPGATAEQPATASMALGATPPSPATTQPVPAATQPARPPLPTLASPTTTQPQSQQPQAQQPESQPGSDTSGLPGELSAVQALAERAIAERRLVDARTQLNKILVDPRVGEKDREGVRRWMAELNRDLVFSATAYPSDPLVEPYQVQKGDSLIKISRKVNSVTEAGFIQRVNGVSANSLRVGQNLKIVRGPFHAVVSKSAFRLDIFAGPTPGAASIGTSTLGAGAEPGWTYIRSFNVGLGKEGGTPLGPFKVKEGSKLIDPPWVNPVTGEKFAGKDPKNPIGLRWIGLQGLDEHTKTFNGYGIHATIQPESIGKEMSMGCVRMAEEDVEVVYDMLVPGVSVVKIVP